MGDSKKKRGRPKKDTPLNRVVKFKISEEEANELEDILKISGMNKSDFLRDSVRIHKDLLRTKYGVVESDSSENEYFDDGYDFDDYDDFDF